MPRRFSNLFFRRKKPYRPEDDTNLEVTPDYRRRLAALYGVLLACILIFAAALYNAQVVNGADYYATSASRIAQEEDVEASRGVITDRNGKLLVSNRQVYTVTFDEDALEAGEDENAAILRLLSLLEDYGITWEDTLPLSAAPVRYSFTGSGTQRSHFQAFLEDLGWSEKELTEDDFLPELTAEAAEELGLAPGSLRAEVLMDLLREHYGIDPALSDSQARKIIGVRYELDLRAIINATSYLAPYVMAQDIPVEVISILSDGRYAGAVVDTQAVRQYHTEAAAHVLGRIGKIQSWSDELAQAGYRMDDLIGLSGAEQAFEAYLRGTDGTRAITTNEEGRITAELYTQEPQPGGNVALTIDIDFQAQVEEILSQAVAEMNEEDGDETRGAAAAVVQVGTGDVLALASYPTFSLTDYDPAANLANPANPEFNRALMGTYAPGSTFKPITAVAGLESGAITPETEIRTRGVYTFYDDYQPKCWIYRQYGGTHGTINVSEAIRESCNYFFYEVGRLVGIETLDQYAAAFGLGQPTGIELGERTGVLAGPEYSQSQGQIWYDGSTLQAAIGQSDNLASPLQLANYIATLVGGGDRYPAHLLKSVKSYDNTTLEVLYDEEPLNTVEMSESTLEAVKKGMGELVRTGSVSAYFRSCVVSAGAKTGSAQTGDTVANGVFVCFAPFEDPEIAVAVVIEKGGSGSALASSAVSILNAWFGAGDTGSAVVSENTLLP